MLWKEQFQIESAKNEMYYVSWKSVVTNRFDQKLLKEEEPEIYKKYQKERQRRRFVVKVA